MVQRGPLVYSSKWIIWSNENWSWWEPLGILLTALDDVLTLKTSRLDCEKHSAVCGQCAGGFRPINPSSWTSPRPCPLCGHHNKEQDARLLAKYKVRSGQSYHTTAGFLLPGNILASDSQEWCGLWYNVREYSGGDGWGLQQQVSPHHHLHPYHEHSGTIQCNHCNASCNLFKINFL